MAQLTRSLFRFTRMMMISQSNSIVIPPRHLNKATRSLSSARLITTNAAFTKQQQLPIASTKTRGLKHSSIICHAYSNISCHEAHELSSQGVRTYLDVRTPEEFAAGHPDLGPENPTINIPIMLKNSMGMMSPNPEFMKQVEAAFPDKTVPLNVGCASGKRSLMAVDALSAAGYNDLMNVEGGFSAWAGSNLPTRT